MDRPPTPRQPGRDDRGRGHDSVRLASPETASSPLDVPLPAAPEAPDAPLRELWPGPSPPRRQGRRSRPTPLGRVFVAVHRPAGRTPPDAAPGLEPMLSSPRLTGPRAGSAPRAPGRGPDPPRPRSGGGSPHAPGAAPASPALQRGSRDPGRRAGPARAAPRGPGGSAATEGPAEASRPRPRSRRRPPLAARLRTRAPAGLPPFLLPPLFPTLPPWAASSASLPRAVARLPPSLARSVRPPGPPSLPRARRRRRSRLLLGPAPRRRGPARRPGRAGVAGMPLLAATTAGPSGRASAAPRPLGPPPAAPTVTGRAPCEGLGTLSRGPRAPRP